MRRKNLLVMLLAGAIAVGLFGCLGDLTAPNHENPLDPDNPGTESPEPDRPAGLSAVVADRSVSLSWSISDTTGLDFYRVYRWEVEDEDDEEYEVLHNTASTEYTDTTVRNNQLYEYKVSALNRAGLEGEASQPVRAVPRIFSISIAGGKAKTGSRDVTVTMSASGGTELMKVSNSADLAGAQWVPYQASLAWQLEPGDGPKTVYAVFRESGDNQSDVVSDDIELDTQASIASFTEDTGGEAVGAGETIHFTLDAGEVNGQAYADIGSAVTGIALRDDGTAGDAAAGDGVYERDYVVENGVEVLEASATGRFMDEVGNEAEPCPATGTITILDPPDPVTVTTPIALSERKLSISWSRNNDADFDSYKLYRSYVPGVATSAERELLAEIIDQGDTDHTDWGLEPDSTYYYAVYVTDELGLSEISNEVAGTTLANEPPEPVELYAPWAPADSTELQLSWSRSTADDFMAYELEGWEQDPPNDPQSSEKRLIARIESRGETFYTHVGLVDTLIYWYRVAVVDSFGAKAYSDSVSGSVGAGKAD